jgi:hypothetical protein
LHDAAAQARFVDLANVEPGDAENEEQETKGDDNDSDYFHRASSASASALAAQFMNYRENLK